MNNERESAQLADETERAQLSADQFTQDALARHQRQTTHANTGAVFLFCQVCGDPLQPERIRAIPGCRLCAECKTFEEHEAARRARLSIR